MGAQVLGHASPNVQDFAAARGAAGEIFDTIDRVRDNHYSYSQSLTLCDFMCAFVHV